MISSMHIWVRIQDSQLYKCNRTFCHIFSVGSHSWVKMQSYHYWKSHCRIKWTYNNLIPPMGFFMLSRQHWYIEMIPWYPGEVHHCTAVGVGAIQSSMSPGLVPQPWGTPVCEVEWVPYTTAFTASTAVSELHQGWAEHSHSGPSHIPWCKLHGQFGCKPWRK